MGKATGLRIVRKITSALLDLSPQIIRWPQGHYVIDVINGFSDMDFPNTFRAIDGSYIPIPLPKQHGLTYITSKNFPALIYREYVIISYCSRIAGEVGSVHEARVLRNSEIWHYIHEQAENYFPDNTHVIGDKAYPCLLHLLTPYKDNEHLTRQQVRYKYRLSSARSCIERAIGLLKKRMTCLKFLDVRKIMDFKIHNRKLCTSQYMYLTK